MGASASTFLPIGLLDEILYIHEHSLIAGLFISALHNIISEVSEILPASMQHKDPRA